MAEKLPLLTSTCTCLHAGMWHAPGCRIRDCACEKFKQATISRDHRDGSWMSQGHQRRRKAAGKGPNE